LISLDVTVSMDLDSTEGPPESEKKLKIQFRLSETPPKRTFPRGKVVWWCGVAQGENISKLIY